MDKNHATLLDGNAASKKIFKEVKEKIEKLSGRKPKLGVILATDNPASQIYVKRKMETCREVGIISELKLLPKDILKEIELFNQDPTIDGILVQLPLPEGIDPRNTMLLIDPSKDVDGFHPINVGKMLLGETDGFISCTPLGILTLFEEYGIKCTGKNALVVGRSNIVGKPIASLLMQNTPQGNATVTIAHSKTINLEERVREADIIIAAMGQPELIKGDWIKPGAVVVDVGINRINGKLIGDVEFKEAVKKASYITPVPGGVGPMTIACLLKNTLKSRLKRD